MAGAKAWQRTLGVGVLVLGSLLQARPVTAQTEYRPEAPPSMRAAGRAATPGVDAEQQRKQSVSVTLLTGDKVTLVGGDPANLAIEPVGGDQTRILRRFTYHDHVYVIPPEVSGLIAAKRLDRQLFDITSLVELEYDDDHLDAVPLLVSYSGGEARQRLTAAGADPGRALPAIQGAAFTVEKRHAAGFLDEVSRTHRAFHPGIRRIWLNGKAELDLNESAPQIGAPTAWGLGLTGQGVKVAVLDTGIDETHPDLVGKVVLQKDFTGTGAADLIGHGTHIAGTIAGTGAALNGKYRGIAPDATLLDGKICSLDCSFDDVLAGMEWAAAEGADVVNMSLGSFDFGGIDPFEEAVNRLTAEHGTLFVCASGNDFGEGFVNSPSSAESALAVGAVTKDDGFAGFSNSGPSADGGIKPDLTAPGTSIVAALSGDAETSPILGPPVDGVYTLLSGTSMATPHVAGAAALLIGQHPGWGPGAIKAALMSTAKPNADLTIFNQGAGRVDVGRAVTQPVVAEQGSIHFGFASFPHGDDEPVSRDVTFRNTGGQDVILDVAVDMTGPEGDPAPAGAIALSEPTVTVPAGGTAQVTVTSDTSHAGPNGFYTGHVTATAAGVRLGVPLAVWREFEAYDLTIEATDRDGEPAAFDGWVSGLELFYFENVVSDSGTTRTLRLPPGPYSIDGIVSDLEGPDVGWLGQPIFTLEHDTVWNADLAQARPVSIDVQEPAARLEVGSFQYATFYFDEETGMELPTFFGNGGVILSGGTDDVYMGQVGTNASPDYHVWVNAVVTLNVPTADGDVFVLYDEQRDRLWDGFERTYTSADLAAVDHRFHSTGAGHFLASRIFPIANRPGLGSVVPTLFLDMPAQAVWHLAPSGPGTPLLGWFESTFEFAPLEIDGVVQPRMVTELIGNPGKHDVVGDATPLRAGETYVDHWNIATLGPRTLTANNMLDLMMFDIRMVSDAGGHDGFIATSSAHTALYRDGKLIGESPAPGFVYVPGEYSEVSRYRLETELTRTFSEFSSRQSASWKFTARGSADNSAPTPLLWSASFQPQVDEYNRVRREDTSLAFELRLPWHVPSSEAVPKLTSVRLEYSLDDGRTWRTAPVEAAGTRSEPNLPGYGKPFQLYVGKVQHSRTAQYVSLRLTAEDGKGNNVKQVIIRAYGLR